MISGMPDHRLRKVIGAVALVLTVLQFVFMRAKIHVGITGAWAAASAC